MLAQVPTQGGQNENETVLRVRCADGDAKLFDTMSSDWVNFIKTGDPNGPGPPTWMPFDNTAANSVMYLGTRVQPGPLPNKPGLEFMDAFWSAQLSPSP